MASVPPVALFEMPVQFLYDFLDIHLKIFQPPVKTVFGSLDRQHEVVERITEFVSGQNGLLQLPYPLVQIVLYLVGSTRNERSGSGKKTDDPLDDRIGMVRHIMVLSIFAWVSGDRIS